ncbi:glycine--tRNA ligase subunit beta [Maricaulis sp.]|uniref:glycine--tRNA ligase subunit beta n=1 Tax=Maricaulis sp. TaxID=1486257 RepID=UPI001B090C0E|nr:glycine--tRNA ligase subunit beta [Maricaulis sp.]MBO6797522.1 glycine--tRNA ligase subunit beta [Maricaulis sp.]
MSDLLFEIFCEEIPAGMQAKAANDLEAAMVKALGEAGLKAAETASYVGARRLVVTMSGLPAKAEDVREERKGPRVGAPDKAVEGFLRGAGLDSLDACEQREDKKGAFWVALIDKPGRQTTDVLTDAIPAILSNFHWPKSMKIGEGEKAQRWVRPIQRILCVFDGAVVPVKVFGLEAGNETEGHRVAGRGPFTVTGWDDYKAQLEGAGHVTIDADERKRLIMDGATKACGDAGLELVEDQGLLNEVCGLVEWPVPVLGEMDPDFLDLPPEVITLTMKTHQKYFAVRDPKTNKLSAHFVTVANQQAPDGGKAIAAGNSRVLSARLSDARHFWDNDRKTPLSEMADQLSKITFHEKLGTVADKVRRVAAVARNLAPLVEANPSKAAKAAELAKADLVSEMVYEFPELQGAMGRYYALEQGEDAAVADAIKAHYKPQGPSDEVPVEPVSAAVALADKLDTLVGFWAIDEKPTGSKDPFALRRAALGVIRIVLDGNFRLSLRKEIGFVACQSGYFWLCEDGTVLKNLTGHDTFEYGSGEQNRMVATEILPSILAFFAHRLKVHLRDEGIRHDVIDAVFALGDDDLVRVTARSRALQAFLDTEDGTALLAGFKRASNILNKTDDMPEGHHDAAAAVEDAEKALMAALADAGPKAKAALEAEDFTAAMAALAMLRAPIDAFFDTVTVNADDAGLRRNRLLLLSDIREAISSVADFSRIEG